MSRSLTTVLVANRGEIARRIFRSARAMGARCVAVYTEADADAPFVSEADEAVRLPGGYLEGAAVVAAAKATGADAVHPGYGFLAENSRFAAEVEAGGIAWVGPPPRLIEAMGDKLAAKHLSRSAGVPTLPTCDDPRAGEEIGYPVLVKAAAGGGGKGMRIVRSPAELDDALAGARREAALAFGDDRLFLERYLPRARHVEVQLLGDAHGGLVHLGERECSIQRRYQKVIEECPSPGIDDRLREQMADAALRLGAALGYRSAGTVEFIVDDTTGEFYFMEVNARLQVEHPVTEAVTGIDLVSEQLRIAAGEPLGFGQSDVARRGHAIEARLYAEDPAAGFLPATGRLAAFAPAEDGAARWDSGVVAGSVVSVDFDPLLAKVIAHAPSRNEAAGRLARELERLHIGGVATNRDFLTATLRHPAFLAGDTTTDFIDRLRPATTMALDEGELERAALAAALWLQGEHRAQDQAFGGAPSGWHNGRLPPQRVVLRAGTQTCDVRYEARRDGSFAVIGVGSARVHRWSPQAIDVEIEGRRATMQVTGSGEHLYVQVARGTLALEVVPRFVVPRPDAPTGGLVAPMPGVVIEVRCAAGERVNRRQTLVVLEAMKMEHHVEAPRDGVVAELRVAKGQHVENGEVLLVLDGGGGEGERKGESERSVEEP